MKKTVLIRTSLAITMVFMWFASASSHAQGEDQVFAKELKLVESLKVYNKQLSDQIKAQAQARAEIQASIAQAGSLTPQVAPILDNMLSSLEQFIRQDLPFKRDERLGSIAELKALMLNSEVSNSDRFRNIMDIYTVETEYGNTYEAYPGSVKIDGVETPVDILRVGRLGLYYQTKDQKRSGMWDATSNAWVALPDSNNRELRKAIKVAAKTIAPELMTLPVSAPKGN